MIAYLGIIAVVVICIAFFQQSYTGTTCSYSEYVRKVEAGLVRRAEIEADAKVPTGRITLGMENGSVSVFGADIDREITFLQQNDVEVTMAGIPHDSYFTTIVVPVILIVLGCLVVFLLLGNRQGAAGGNGGANNMMNFGRSRTH